MVEVCVEPFEIWSHEISNYEFNIFVNETGYVSKAETGWGIDTGVNIDPGSAVFIAYPKILDPIVGGIMKLVQIGETPKV